MKICNSCNLEKNKNEFHNGKNKCKNCSIQFYKKEENIEHYIKGNKEFLIHLGVSENNIPLNIEDNSVIVYSCENKHTANYVYSSIKRVGLKCKRCFTLKPYYELKKLLETEGYDILTNENEFKGSSISKLSFKCKNGHILNSKCSHIRGGTRCKFCNYDKIRNERATPIDEIYTLLKSIDYELLEFIDDYKNRSSVIRVKCNNNHTYESQIASLLNGSKCRECYIMNNRGENHPSWKGGRRTLYHQLRSVINPWREDSLKSSKYTCFVSNDSRGGNLIVHHFINFYKIIDETLRDLKLPILENIGEYDTLDLFNIETICLEKHYKYGFGIVMTKDIHKLFHKIYGNKNNNMEQVLEFKKDYQEGKYNDLINN